MNCVLLPLNRHLVPRILIIFLLSVMFTSVSAQSLSRGLEEFDKLAHAHNTALLTDYDYLVKADSIVHQLFSEGVHFETEELVQLLETYKRIAWSKPEYSNNRISYHTLFFNNARLFKKRGASIYYAEKITQEYRANNEENPLMEQLQKNRIYQELLMHDKIIENYEADKAYIEKLPELIEEGTVSYPVGLNAMYVLSPTISAYIKMDDTTAVTRKMGLARQISTIVGSHPEVTRTQMLYNDMLMIGMELSLANFEQDFQKARKHIDQMEALKTVYSDQVTNFIDVNLIPRRIDNYLALGLADSARYYIQLYESLPTFGDRQKAALHVYQSKLETIGGNYKAAYESVVEALKLEQEVQAQLMAESSDLLYAFTQAEHSEISLKQAEAEKRQRTRWLRIISIAALLTIMGIYMLMVSQSRKAARQIENLNNMADIQIMSLEEIKHQAIRNERKRLGQDLHDSLSASIASVKHQLEVISFDIENLETKEKIHGVLTTLVKIYDAARQKSHEWFFAGNTANEESFEQLIHTLTDSALPDNRYQKNIHIDNDSLAGHDMDAKIALLKVVQEAIANIIKHAKATAVDILIYAEEGALVLSVKDNGKGMAKEATRRRASGNMGLQSIRRRVQSLNGELTIHSDMNGTEITALIPH